MKKIKTSVIVAVYNHFNWLKLILDALGAQSYRDFEVVIADDGSSEETIALIQQYIAEHPQMKIVHSWIEDRGWRKNICLNEAVRKASGDYLIFIDGDCVPHRRFVEDHVRLSKPGVLLGGRRLDMPAEVSAVVETWQTLPKRPFTKLWTLYLKNINKIAWKQLRRAIHFPVPVFSRLLVKDGGIIGCNFSLYRKDLEAVNGFDERYLAPGTGEDLDIDGRLQHAGIRHVRFSHYALMVHRHHARLPFDSPRNAELLAEMLEKKLTYIPTGLKQ